ncbi:hypothetical protein [Pseudomonas sp.]|uniref:hypothetical protein n=1 Tax=Pseudomonas sp. TaxID=306 RepID=UPI003D6E3A01
MTDNQKSLFGPENVVGVQQRLQESFNRQQVERREEQTNFKSQWRKAMDDCSSELTGTTEKDFPELDELLAPTQSSASCHVEQRIFSAQQRQILPEEVGLFATVKSIDAEYSPLEKERITPASSPSSFTESYKFGTVRKRTAKLHSPQNAWTLAAITGLLSTGFGAISHYPFSQYQQQLARSWLRSRYWGQAIILNPPQVDDLPEWDDLPADVKHFFKLSYLLSQPGAQFITIRLSPQIGEKALAAPRGPADWLANKIKRALKSVGIPADHIAFALEFAPKQAKTLHKLHIHGAACIPVEMRRQVSEALTDALAPDYKQHGTNEAVRLEAPEKAGDVAKYVVKESKITKNRIIRLLNQNRSNNHGNGASPHRASELATAGGRAIYNDLRGSLFGNQEAFNQAFHPAIKEILEGGVVSFVLPKRN